MNNVPDCQKKREMLVIRFMFSPCFTCSCCCYSCYCCCYNVAYVNPSLLHALSTVTYLSRCKKLSGSRVDSRRSIIQINSLPAEEHNATDENRRHTMAFRSDLRRSPTWLFKFQSQKLFACCCDMSYFQLQQLWWLREKLVSLQLTWRIVVTHFITTYPPDTKLDILSVTQ